MLINLNIVSSTEIELSLTMASEAIAEIEELIKVEEVGEGDLQVGAAAGRQTV